VGLDFLFVFFPAKYLVQERRRTTTVALAALLRWGTEICVALPSERLSQAEEEIEVTRLPYVWLRIRNRQRIVDVHGVDRRVQVVAEVYADRPNRGMVTHAKTCRV